MNPEESANEVHRSATESWLAWSKTEVATAWAQASEKAREGWEALKERVAASAPSVPESGTAPAEPFAQLYRLNDHARCGVDGHPVQVPWENLKTNYGPPVNVPGHTLEEVVKGLTDAGAPLHPGDVVGLPEGGAHVFQPWKYAADFARHLVTQAASPSVWHQLVTPSSLAILGATVVASTAAKYAFQPEERGRTTVEHSR